MNTETLPPSHGPPGQPPRAPLPPATPPAAAGRPGSGESFLEQYRTPLIVVAVLLFAVFGYFLLIGGDGDSTAADAAALSSAEDADAMVAAASAQTAIETFAVDNGGDYSAATAESLEAIQPALAGTGLTVEAAAGEYTLSAPTDAGSLFTVTRTAAGAVAYTCTPPGTGECQADGAWVPLT